MKNSIDESNSFFQQVYGWMFGGLAISGLIAYFVAFNKTLYDFVLGDPLVLFGLIILELIMVLVLAFFLKRLSPAAAMICFIIFSIVNGATLSVIFLTYTIQSIFLAFGIAALMFGAMSIYGMITKKDLTKMGTIMFMGLLGVIIASLVNVIFKNPLTDYIISIITVVVFTGLTAYDTQRIKERSLIGNEDSSENTKAAISGALSLYLDLINLVLSLLRIFGQRR